MLLTPKMQNVTLELIVDTLRTEINFHEKSFFESFLESQLKDIDYIPHVTQYYVTLLDQRIAKKYNGDLPALVVLLMVYVEKDTNALEFDLNDELYRFFTDMGDDLSRNIARSIEPAFKDINSISPIKVERGTAIPNKFESRYVPYVIIVGILFPLITMFLAIMRSRRKNNNSKSRISYSPPSCNFLHANDSVLDKDQASDKEIEYHPIEKVSNDESSLNQLWQLNRKKILTKIPRMKYSNAKRSRARQKIRRLLENTDGTMTVASKLSTIPEAPNSIATSNVCDSNVSGNQPKREGDEETQFFYNDSVIEECYEEISKDTTVRTEMNERKGLQPSNQMKQSERDSNDGNELFHSSQLHKIENHRSSHKSSELSANKQSLSQRLISKPERSAFEPYPKEIPKSNIQTDATQNYSNISSSDVDSELQKLLEISDSLKSRRDLRKPVDPPELVRMINPSFCFEVEHTAQAPQASMKGCQLTYNEVEKSVDHKESDSHDSSKQDPKDGESMDRADSPRNISIHRGLKPNIGQPIHKLNEFFISSSSADNLSLSTISSDAYTADLDIHEESNALIEHAKIGVKSIDGKIYSLRKISYSSSSDDDWIDESNVLSIQINNGNNECKGISQSANHATMI